MESLIPYLVRNLLGIDDLLLEEIPDDVQVTVERRPDFLKRVVGVKPYLLHLEFQTVVDSEMPYRMLEYYALLLRKYRLPVRQVVVQINQPANPADARLQTSVLQFQYEVVNLRDIDCQLFLQSEQPEEVLMAVLANFGSIDPGRVVSWVLERLNELTQSRGYRFQRYANQLLVLSKLRNLEYETFKLLEAMPISLGIDIEDMYIYQLAKSKFYQQGIERGTEMGVEQGLERGIETGIEKGIEQGEREQKVETTLNLHRMGVLTVAQIAEAIGDTESFVRQVIDTHYPAQ